MKKATGDPGLARQLDAGFRYLGAGDLPKAEAAFRSVIGKSPRHDGALHGLGVALYLAQRHAEAEAWIRQAIAVRASPDFLTNLGLVLAAQARFVEAVDAYRAAVAAGARTAKVLNNLGNLLSAQNLDAEAEASLRQAIDADAAYAMAYKNLGVLLDKLGRHDEAEARFRQAIALDPASGDFWLCYGSMLERIGRLADADAAFGRAKRWESLQFLRRRRASWHGLADIDRAALDLIASGQVGDATPWTLMFMPSLSPQQHREAGRRFALSRWGRELAAQPVASGPVTAATAATTAAAAAAAVDRRLTIGYLSADFHDHATLHLLAAVLERHDVDGFDVHLYSYGKPRVDSYTARIAAMPATFHEVSSWTDRQIADHIARDRVQMLVDLKGYTTSARLGIVALKPAPVTLSWLGYPGTLGHPGLADFIVGDAVVTPPERAEDFSETLALMPHSYQPNDAVQTLDAPPSRSQVGLPEGGFVFCSFNQVVKLTAEVFSLWLTLLKAVPDSVLWLLRPSDEEAVRHLQVVFAVSGLEEGRLVWAPRLPRDAHLVRLQLADLALDTFPVGSHTTGSDALRAGVPMVARSGDLFASRVSESLLRAVGLPELVARSDDAYVDIALSLAREPLRLQETRRRLAEHCRTSPLFDPARFTRDLERLYMAIWERATGPDRHSRLPVGA